MNRAKFLHCSLCKYTHVVCACPFSWAARHTTVCLDDTGLEAPFHGLALLFVCLKRGPEVINLPGALHCYLDY